MARSTYSWFDLVSRLSVPTLISLRRDLGSPRSKAFDARAFGNDYRTEAAIEAAVVVERNARPEVMHEVQVLLERQQARARSRADARIEISLHAVEGVVRQPGEEDREQDGPDPVPISGVAHAPRTNLGFAPGSGHSEAVKRAELCSPALVLTLTGFGVD